MPAGHAGGLAALAAAAAYALLAGFALPTQRALVMLAAGLGALSLRRVVTPAGGIAIALVAVVLLDPNAVLGGGFWLSFAAVAVIFLVMNGRRAGRPLSAWWRIQWSLALGLVPVLAAWGLPVAAIAPLVNLVAVPWFTLVIVPLLFLTLGLLPIPSWGTGLLELDLWLLDRTLAALQYASETSGWRWTPAAPGLPGVLLAAAAVPVLLFPLPPRYRVLGLVLLLPLVFRPGESVAPGALRLAMLDVGQGLATVVRTPTRTLVYDLGPRFSTGFNAAEAAVIPFLADEGVERVDRLVLSHDDADHAGAWQAFVARTRVDLLMAGQPGRLAVPARPCRRGDAWTWDGVRFEILHPEGARSAGHDNDASCVLRIRHPRATFLLTGDITRAAERELAGRGVDADFVVVPHHGSRSSSSPALVRATGARFALVSAGYRNRYGFPDPSVVDRWRSAGARLINTADAGAVIVDVGAEGMPEITRFREAARRYWHR
jgi:competence protein ComEC